jgi:predicted SnoaL-like aldol condensation-catalyzing enzyme
MNEWAKNLHPKTLVTTFFELAFVERKVREAYERFVSDDYIQHNSSARNGRAAAVEFLEPLYASQPGRHAKVCRVIAEQNLVVVHAWIRQNLADPGAAHIDIFRVHNGWIVEHWDVVQALTTLDDARNRF